MTNRTTVREALDGWRSAERELDGGDRDADYGQLWSDVEEGRQGYQRAIAERDDDEREDEDP
jgi:hypothetical protein